MKKIFIILGVILLITAAVLVFVLIRNRNQQNTAASPSSPASSASGNVNSAGSKTNNLQLPAENTSTPVQSRDYTDKVFNIQTKLPDNLYLNKDLNSTGLYGSSMIFSTQNQDAPTFLPSDVSISVTISKGVADAPGIHSLDDIKQQLSKTQADSSHYQVSAVRNLTVAGFPAIQYMEKVLPNGDCYLHTYFQQGANKVDSIELEASDCDSATKYADDYYAIVNNFQFTK